MILISITKKSGDMNDKLLNEYNIDKIEFINYAGLQFSLFEDEKKKWEKVYLITIIENSIGIVKGGREKNINTLLDEFRFYPGIKPIKLVNRCPSII